MGRFEKLNDDIHQLADKILEDKELCKLIHYPDNNPLDQPNVSGRDILHKRLLLFRPKLPLAKETGTFVTIIPSKMRPSRGEYYIRAAIEFYIYSHQDVRDIYYYDKNKNDKTGDRPLMIVEKITNIMDTIDFSIGKPNLDTVDVVATNNSTFSGYVVRYLDVDFRGGTCAFK